MSGCARHGVCFPAPRAAPEAGKDLSFLVVVAFERLRVFEAEILEAVFEAGFRVEAPIEQLSDIDIDFL